MTGNRRCIGLDVHREFAQVAIWQGGTVAQAGTFATTPEGVREFAAGLGPADEVALEATGNTWAIATVLARRYAPSLKTTASANTLTGLAADITALHTAIEARVRSHEEQLRQLKRADTRAAPRQ
jgi:hypothetical protein